MPPLPLLTPLSGATALFLAFDLLVAALLQPSLALPGREEARKLVVAPQEWRDPAAVEHP